MYGLSRLGSRSLRGLLAATVIGLFAVTAVSCGGQESASPEPTESPTAVPTTPAPATSHPTPTEPPTTMPTATEEPEPLPTEPTPTKDGGMSPEQSPPVVTDADDGRSFSLAVGSETSLQLDSAWFWDEPAVQGDAIVLTRVDYFTDPGFMEWIVTAQQPGTAVIMAHGEPNCDDASRCPPRDVTITFKAPA